MGDGCEPNVETEEVPMAGVLVACVALGLGELHGLGLEQQECGDAEWTTARHA